jgi:chromosome segregation ATPase
MSNLSQPSPDASGFSKGELRVDQPHGISRVSHRSAEPGVPQLVGASVEVAAEAGDVGFRVEHSLEQLREHAAQLADRLQSEQGELDRRQHLLAAQEADLEAKWQNARQWLAERQQELEQRAEIVSARELEILEREAAAEVRVTELTQVREESLAEREGRLVVREAELEDREATLQERLTALDEDRAAWDERNDRLQTREVAIEARHREIDGRQAQLYRDIEEFITDKTRAEERMTDVERAEAKVADWESRLQAQSSELERQMDSLRERAGELEIGRAELRKSLSEQTTREAELDSAERQLGYRQQEIEAALARYERLGVTEEKMQLLQEEVRKFAARRRYLDEAESQLAQEKAELADSIQELTNHKRQLEEQGVRERRALVAQQQVAQNELQHRTQQLEQREAEFDSREAALAQMQAELRVTQREVLEMRLATEETWAQLSGALAPASLTRSISQVRAKLADHYRVTLDELGQRSAQLENVRHELAHQLQSLESQRTELNAWAERRHTDIESQAARLVAREQELDRQQLNYEHMESQWHIERTDYQAEIRRLLATIRDLEIEEMRAA